MGRLTADPELRQTSNGISNVRFTVAIPRNFAPKDEERQSDFVTVVAWRQTAEFVSKYFSKGKVIIVEGTLRNNNFTDSVGVKHYGMDVYAENVQFGESKTTSQNAENKKPSTAVSAPKPAAPAICQELDQFDISEFEPIFCSEGELPF